MATPEEPGQVETLAASTRREQPADAGGQPDLSTIGAGLDALETRLDTPPSRTRRFVRSGLPPLVATVLLLVVWQLLVVAKVKPDYELPSPLAVWHSIVDQARDGTLGPALWNSVHRCAFGFAASTVLGTPLGLLVARVRVVRTAIGPILSGLQSLPSVAWVPAAILWFGISDATIYTVVLLGAVPSIANGIVAGVDQVPPILVRAGKTMGASGLRGVWHVLLPASLPGYLAGLKQGWAFAWRSLMAAELIAIAPQLGPGLGQMLAEGRTNFDVAMVFAGIILILLVGIGVDLLVFAPLERRVLRARGLSEARR